MFDEVRTDGLGRQGLSAFADDRPADAPAPSPSAGSTGERISAGRPRSPAVDAFVQSLLGTEDDADRIRAAG
ncbi:MAG TPA: hypothetical protein VHN98_01005 [Acidimicrobiales bacterium]|nr:hypothetical protein [Acidimicrobiales bacterium]